MWAVAAHPRTGLTPMIPTPSTDSVTNAMRFQLDLEVDLLTNEEASRLDGHVPGHPPVLSIDRRLRRCGEHRLPLHVRTPSKELPRERDGPRDVLDPQIAVELER